MSIKTLRRIWLEAVAVSTLLVGVAFIEQVFNALAKVLVSP